MTKLQRGLRDYIKTGALTLALAGTPAFVAYSHFDTADRVARATIGVESLKRQEEGMMDDIRRDEGLHLCGLETLSTHREVYRMVMETPRYQRWEAHQHREERALLYDLFCDRSIVTEVGLFTDSVVSLIQNPLETILDGLFFPPGGVRAVQSRYCGES